LRQSFNRPNNIHAEFAENCAAPSLWLDSIGAQHRHYNDGSRNIEELFNE